ncbi:hypothetical protein DSM112329_02759 [Paraconexibacter sp. AEG42_29]|uniref:Endonuclease/exonuclease/phosphatase domain-containing protein n=1 Tax=Paraconexibacter sp. AEG42_29 TaxID=2997339 RepID=A0AAU7AW29_9ACTN
MRRRDLAAWALAAAVAATLWSSYLPWPVRGRLDAVAPFTQLLAIRPLLATVALVSGIAGLVVLRRLRWTPYPALLLLVAASAALGQVAPRALSRADPAPASAPRLTIVVANLLRSSVAPAVLVDLQRRTGADVLALPETNVRRARGVALGLRAATGEAWVAEGDRVIGSPTSRTARPTALVVRASLGPVRLAERASRPGSGSGRNGQVLVRLTRIPDSGGRPVRGATATVAAVHPRPPLPGPGQATWRSDLLALRDACRRGVLVAGDLNATIDHSPMRALKRAGCEDAAAATGAGLQTTWAGGPLRLVRPTIDHVLTSGDWRATDAGVLDLRGSDHRAVWATVVAAPG